MNLTIQMKVNSLFYLFFAAKRGISMDMPQGPKKLKPRYDIDSDMEAPSHIFLQYLVNLKVEQSFARDDNDNKTVEKIAQEKTLRTLFEDESLKLQFDRKNYNFYLITQRRERFDFNSLSDGYSAVFKILSDLILRMEHTEGYDMQGIVLIDEIETHLHVELQKKILFGAFFSKHSVDCQYPFAVCTDFFTRSRHL
ncbi:MAG TPA: ATP-binding protein [Thioploca sp.]|nr:ATP-binding protein [Thioploca sp.]